MPDAYPTTWAGGQAQVAKSTIEREAREAYAAGQTPAEGCPYPFKTAAAMHWLAIYNLCIPLPSRHAPQSS